MNRKLRVVVFTQEDRFFIPTNILKASKVCDIIEIVDNQSKNSFDNRLSDLIKWFGFCQCAVMGFRTVGRIIAGICDQITGYKAFDGTTSVKNVSRRLKVEFKEIKNINDPAYVQHIREIAPDLIISYSAHR